MDPKRRLTTMVQTIKMRRAGISWAGVTWPNKSIRKLTKPINKPCTVRVKTPRSGALLAFYTIRSTNIATLWTRILVPFD